MPAAVSVHKDAKLATTLSQIAQQLSSKVPMTDGGHLARINTGARLFDAEGREVAGENEAIFRAQVRPNASGWPHAVPVRKSAAALPSGLKTLC